MKFKQVALVACVLLCLGAIAAKLKVSGPVPDSVKTAKKVFIADGGTRIPYAELFGQVEQWKRYQIVDKPENADIVLVMWYSVDSKGPSTWTSQNFYTGQQQDYSFNAQQTHNVMNPKLQLLVFTVKDRERVWMATDYHKLSPTSKTRNQEFLKSTDRLFEEFKKGVEAPARK